MIVGPAALLRWPLLLEWEDEDEADDWDSPGGGELVLPPYIWAAQGVLATNAAVVQNRKA